VLHNVGNVLNSINVSATLLQDRLTKSKAANLSRTTALLHQHGHELAAFLTTDPKGKLIPDYLIKLADHIQTEQHHLLAELRELTTGLDHIKEVVAMQQSYARVSGVIEDLAADALVEDALRINLAGLVRHGVEVRRQFGPGKAQIVVTDNGLGIAPENLTRIFSHGFTTKKDGHGFGLHLGALAAKEMGGSLSARSDGPGKGATFTLELPTAQPKETWTPSKNNASVSSSWTTTPPSTRTSEKCSTPLPSTRN